MFTCKIRERMDTVDVPNMPLLSNEQIFQSREPVPRVTQLVCHSPLRVANPDGAAAAEALRPRCGQPGVAVSNLRHFNPGSRPVRRP